MNKNYSVVFQSKIPSFIRDDPAYSNFISFFEAYYTWFDDTYNITGFGKKIDIDYDYDQFLPYFQADFLPNFPNFIATDKIKLIKLVKELYKAKGIHDSFKFLFKALYNSYSEVIPTRDFVFKASSGRWLVPKSIKIKSTDPKFLNINNYKIFGVNSKTVGIVESSKYSGSRIQIYLSNIERLYFSGEEIQILDINNKEVYFLNGEPVQYDTTPPVGSIKLSSKIIGSLSSINIDPILRGQKYKVGDPVSIIGGFSNIEAPILAKAEVSEVTLGQITDITIQNGGFGFTVSPDSSADVIYNNEVDLVANCIISLVDYSQENSSTLFPLDIIANNYNTTLSSNNFNFFANANINSTLANTLSFSTLLTYPISGVTVKNGGNGYEYTPSINFNSFVSQNNLKDIGILSPIQISNGGTGYTANDTIVISGGAGVLAFARISALSGNGTISQVSYYSSNTAKYTSGGMGYELSNLPSISVTSNTGSNASLYVPGVLGSGVIYNVETNSVGAITKIHLTENGEDYSSTPEISLRVQDIAISNVHYTQIENCVVFQGNSLLSSTFSSNVDSFEKISNESLATFDDDIYRLRVYNYKGSLQDNLTIKLYDTITQSVLSTFNFNNTYSAFGFTDGVKIYGDGTAKATAKFLDGLIVGDGKYLNTDGQPSAFSYLQSDIYNNSTYFLSSEKDFSSYKDTILGLVHPIGSRLYPRTLLRSNLLKDFNSNSTILMANTTNDVELTLISNGTNFSNTFSYSSNTTLSNNISLLAITNNNMNLYSKISSINTVSKIIRFNEFIQYKFQNIYSGHVSSNSVTIFIENYPNTRYNSNSFISVGDNFIINSDINKVIQISNNVIYFSNNFSNNYSSNINFSVSKNLVSNNISIYTSA